MGATGGLGASGATDVCSMTTMLAFALAGAWNLMGLPSGPGMDMLCPGTTPAGSLTFICTGCTGAAVCGTGCKGAAVCGSLAVGSGLMAGVSPVFNFLAGRPNLLAFVRFGSGGA